MVIFRRKTGISVVIWRFLDKIYNELNNEYRITNKQLRSNNGGKQVQMEK